MDKRARRRMLDTMMEEELPLVNKKLNFEDQCDEVMMEDELRELHQFDLELESHNTFDISLSLTKDLLRSDEFSPCRTRSGVVYESGIKKRKIQPPGSRRNKKIRSRTHSGQSGTGSLADSESEPDSSSSRPYPALLLDMNIPDQSSPIMQRLAVPPPLNYYKVPMSRMVHREREVDIPSSPISSSQALEDRITPVKNNYHNGWPIDPTRTGLLLDSSPLHSPSPPTNTMKAMRLFDGLSSPNSACQLISSPRSAPRIPPLKSRLLFDCDGDVRRSSCPGPYNPSTNTTLSECDSTSTSMEKPKLANINPFTPVAMMTATKKRNRSARNSSVHFSPSTQRELQQSLDSLSEPGSEDEEEGGRFSPLPTKRVRVSDINITRYQEEFLELQEVACGEFGMVKKARHRLDGIIYAIKMSKSRLRINSHDEKMAMNEVFAHAALMKHKHVLRYFNSWVEKGQVYIQNEFCEGGSLAKQIDERRMSGIRFSEPELKRILIHVSKGLQYIHNNQLVHLDIKPGNILISIEQNIPSPLRIPEHSDSGAASGDLSPRYPKVIETCSSGDSSPGDMGDKLCYKIGDLGHVAPIHGGEVSPEEGDCRYMAPEFLEMEVDRSRLTKADIFSLGLTVFEAASLRQLPRNSLDDPNYENLKQGKLPYLSFYSAGFNNLLAKMVNPDPVQRPTAARLLANSELNPGMNKSKYQLHKELSETREKLLLLEQQLSNSARSRKIAKRKHMKGSKSSGHL